MSDKLHEEDLMFAAAINATLRVMAMKNRNIFTSRDSETARIMFKAMRSLHDTNLGVDAIAPEDREQVIEAPQNAESASVMKVYALGR